MHATGSIRGVYKPGCELFRKRIECAIMMKADENREKEEAAGARAQGEKEASEA